MVREGTKEEEEESLQPLTTENLDMSRGKPKYDTTFKMQQCFKGSFRHIMILALVLILSLGVFKLYQSGSSGTVISKDRSHAYNVKVFPKDLDDEALSNLPKENYSYLAMIDAGSSGCRAHIYRYGKLGSTNGPLYVLPKHVSLKVKPGLSSFANNPVEAGPSLKGLIDFMKEQVPEVDWAVTPIWLKATAGLRMLDSKQSDAILGSVRKFLGDSATSPFLFRPSWARIIPGNEEGGFGWIAYNYLMKIIGPRKDSSGGAPFAVVEMGGASSQVSQVAPSKVEAEKIPPNYRFSFTIEDETFHLYTHSYLGFGAEQARVQLNKILTRPNINNIEDPCLNHGYFRSGSTPPEQVYEGPGGIFYNLTGVSNAMKGICVKALIDVFDPTVPPVAARHLLQVAGFNRHIADEVSRHLQETNTAPMSTETEKTYTEMVLNWLKRSMDVSNSGSGCDAKHPAPYAFNCIHQPDFVKNSENFLLFENFYYVSSAIGVKSIEESNSGTSQVFDKAPTFPLQTTPKNILEATYKVCTTEWKKMNSDYPLDSQGKDNNIKLCFGGSLAYSFLVYGLKIPTKKVVTIQKEVGSNEIEWALGAAYKEAADFLKRSNLRPT